MKIAIVGAYGFVGSHIAQAAMRRGWMVKSIGRNTPLNEIIDADAVVHTVGTFMEDQRYKKLLSSTVTPKSIATLAALRLGLAPGNPLAPKITFDEGNFQPAAEAAKILAKKPETSKRIPYVYISATDSPAVERGYTESKRKAERFLAGLPYLRAVFLRPGFISPKHPAKLYEDFSPRNIIANAMQLVNSRYAVTVDAVAEAACDAIEDSSIEGVVECDVIKQLES